jgi:hypothetical protein
MVRTADIHSTLPRDAIRPSPGQRCPQHVGNLASHAVSRPITGSVYWSVSSQPAPTILLRKPVAALLRGPDTRGLLFMPTAVTIEEIQQLEHVLATFHTSHWAAYGPQSLCSEATCVEGKAALHWLTKRVLTQSNPRIGPHFACLLEGNVIGLLCLSCGYTLAWSPQIRFLACVHPAHRCMGRR